METGAQGCGNVVQRQLYQVHLALMKLGAMLGCRGAQSCSKNGSYVCLAPVPCRQKFEMVRSKALALVGSLSQVGPEQSVDLDNAGMRLALDVVALVMPPIVSTPASVKYVYSHEVAAKCWV